MDKIVSSSRIVNLGVQYPIAALELNIDSMAHWLLAAVKDDPDQLSGMAQIRLSIEPFQIPEVFEDGEEQ